MSWIKIETTLPRDMDVRKISRSLGISRREALGLAVDWFCYLDTHTETGALGIYPDELDEDMQQPGAYAALESAGWVALGEDGTVIVLNFDRHNGRTAKERATTAARVAKCKQAKRQALAMNHEVTDTALPECAENAFEVTAEACQQVTAAPLPRKDKSKKESSPIGERKKEAATVTATEAAVSGCRSLTGSIPESADEVACYLLNVVTLPMTPAQKSECAAMYYADMMACGWVDAKRRPVQDWRYSAHAYAARWAANARTQARPQQQPGGRNANANAAHAADYDISGILAGATTTND